MRGPLGVGGNTGPVALGGSKQRAVLAYLVLRANTLVPAERLIDDVWGDEPPAAARNVLQTYVSRLRKALGAERLERRPGGYVLHAEPSEIDARRFEALVEDARRTAASDPAGGGRCIGRPTRCGRARARRPRRPAVAAAGDRPSRGARVAATEERVVAERRPAATPSWSPSWRR